jgi:hypothetical protein
MYRYRVKREKQGGGWVERSEPHRFLGQILVVEPATIDWPCRFYAMITAL